MDGDRTGWPLDDFIAKFADPPGDMRFIPLVRINDRVEQEHLRAELGAMTSQGVQAAHMYAERSDWHFLEESGIADPAERHDSGLPYGYLTEEWAGAVETFLDEAERLGVDVWIYDECDWPSGSAGGTVLEDSRHAYRYLEAEHHDALGPSELKITDRDSLVAASLAQAGRTAETVLAAKDVGETLSLPDGSWKVTVVRARVGTGWWAPTSPDLLDADTCEAFCKATHDWYAARFPDRLGTLIKGYFTDEPTTPPTLIPLGARFPFAPALPWTTNFLAAFEQRAGYDLLPFLPALADRDRWTSIPPHVRCDFWEVVAQLYIENYFRRLRERCDRSGVDLTGHLMGEEPLEMLLAYQAGDPISIYRQFTIPGVDWVAPFGLVTGGATAPALQRLPSLGPVMATSAAALEGRSRVMCEVFSGVGFGSTPEELRRICDTLLVCGVNMMVPISWKHSLRGWNRAIFYPPGLSYQQPWWRHARAFVDYTARQCVVAASGRPSFALALVFPTTILREWFVDRNTIERLNTYMHDLLETFLDEGIQVCVIGEQEAARAVPLPSGEIQIDEVTVPAIGWIEHGDSGVSAPAMPELHKQSAAFGFSLAADARSEARDAARAIRPRMAIRLDTQAGGPVRTHVRVGDGYGTVTAFNDTDRDAHCVLRLPAGVTTVVELDADTGKCREIVGADDEDRSADLPVVVPAGVLRSLLFTDDFAATSLARLPTAPAGSPTVDALDLSSSDWRVTPVSTLSEPAVAGQFYGYDSAEEEQQVQDATAALALGDWTAQGLPYFSGAMRYSTTFAWSTDRQGGQRVELDLGEVNVTARVTLNGRTFGTRAWSPYRFDVTEALTDGDNELEVEVCNSLANHYSRFPLLASAPVVFGGTATSRLKSGLVGPVRLRTESGHTPAHVDVRDGD